MFNIFKKKVNPKILVSGMPKSGTTAILKLLAESTGLTSGNDPFYQLDVLGVSFREDLYAERLSLSDLIRKNPAAFSGDVLKDPNFPFWTKDLKELFPTSKCVHLVRHPADNIRSILDRLNMNGSGDDEQIRKLGINGTWRSVLDGANPSINGENHIERLAKRWCRAIEGIPPIDSNNLVIKYEDFTKAKQDVIESIVAHFGFDVKRDVGKIVDVQFQPKGKSKAGTTARFFNESTYKKILAITAERRKELGYD